MKLLTRIGNSRYLLTPEQFDMIANLITEVPEYTEVSVGEGKGFIGWKKSYVPKIDRPKALDFLQPEQVFTDAQINRITTLAEFYDDETKGEQS